MDREKSGKKILLKQDIRFRNPYLISPFVMYPLRPKKNAILILS